jgi:hypothetical protein
MSDSSTYSQHVLATVRTMRTQILCGDDRAAHILADVQAYVTEAVGNVSGDARRCLVSELVLGYPGLIDVSALHYQLSYLEQVERAA